VIKHRRATITAVPLVLVNIVAFLGQYAYIQDHVPLPWPGQVIFALALESIAIFLTYMAHQALMSEDSAYGLRMLAYLFGAVIGAMNYSHYAGPGMQPAFEAVATGLMSIASPLLWGIYSRRQSRDILKDRGLIESRAVKLGSLRWLLWLPRSWTVFRQAVWFGENHSGAAIAAYTAESYPQVTSPASNESAITDGAPLSIEVADSKAAAVRAALDILGDAVAASAVSAWLAERGWEVTAPHVRTVRAEWRKTGNHAVS